jgi:hypothetical protein
MFGHEFNSRHPLSAPMMKRLVLAALLALAGSVFALQGIGVLPGSVMTGDPKWAVIGTLMLMGAALLAWSAYRRSAS